MCNKNISNLKENLSKLNKNLDNYTTQKKEEYDILLSKNNKKLQSLSQEEGENKINFYLECKNLQDKFNQETKTQIQKIKDNIQICSFQISQKKIEYAKIKETQKLNLKKHDNTLHKIKKIRSCLYKLDIQNKIILIKDENKKTQFHFQVEFLKKK